MTATTKPIFQHRHFKVLADIISKLESETSRTRIALHFADALRDTNVKFDRARFLTAAFGEPDNNKDKVS